jgi:hypothetical protein
MATDVSPGTTRPKPKSDVYTGMLIISLVALLVGCLLLYLDMRRYPSGEPPKVVPPPTAPAK